MSISATVAIQAAAFILLAVILAVSLVSLFVRPARRTIKATLVDNFSGDTIDISHAETSIGKAKTCDIVLTYMSVSRFHAVLSNTGNVWMIFDTHSAVGTKVNGEEIDKKRMLNNGDVILIGAGEFTFYTSLPPQIKNRQIQQESRVTEKQSPAKQKGTQRKNPPTAPKKKMKGDTRK